MINPSAALHDAYAADYDEQIVAYECYLAEALFGLSYDFVRPGERLLDVGIGSGLAAAPFTRAGLRVSGMDFSAAMLDLCRAKGIAIDLKRHDVAQTPWPYAAGAFDHVICCGVLHFLADLEPIFAEVARLLRAGGLFAFTTKSPAGPLASGQHYERLPAGGLEVFSHSSAYVGGLLGQYHFRSMKTLRCFVGQDIFYTWVARKEAPEE